MEKAGGKQQQHNHENRETDRRRLQAQETRKKPKENITMLHFCDLSA